MRCTLYPTSRLQISASWRLMHTPTFASAFDKDKAADKEASMAESKSAYETLVRLEREAKKQQKLIGKLVVRSEFIGSAYGDEELFFQHRFFCPNKKVKSVSQSLIDMVKTVWHAGWHSTFTTKRLKDVLC